MLEVSFEPHRTALVGIDCQQSFFNAQGTPETIATADRINDAVPLLKQRGVAIYSLFSNAPSVEQSGMLDILAQQAFSFEKKHESGFIGSDIEQKLRSAFRPKIILSGFHTTTCIRLTAIGGVKAGFQVAVASDLIGEGMRGRNLTNREIESRAQNSIAIMKKEGVTVRPLHEILGM